ncbi:MAG TPA: DUF4286 family protein [Xanthomonadaceae bacterium]|nr:DUF4286 family protein [Xanthomonadaceae bacterium]
MYEVNVEIGREHEREYRRWLTAHVAQIAALPGFLGAQVLEVLQDEDTGAGRLALSVRYRLRDRAALEDYLREHAARLRADGASRFPDMRAWRRVLAEPAD